MQTTRREFLKVMGVVAFAATVPLEWGQVVVELEPVVDEKALMKAWTLERYAAAMGITVDLEKMWQVVHLEDQWGHKWHTEDEGQTWAWDNHWFNAQGDCSWA